ncbi:MAG: hypothetical protein ACRDCF_00315 [Mycoplasmoidaceae bacterium]
MMKKRFNFKFLAMLSIPIVGISLIIPVFTVKSVASYRINLFTTYDNALDNSIALGIAPDYDNYSFSGRLSNAEYLNDYINYEKTQFVRVDVMDGNEINRLPIENLKADTIVLNEWMKADEYKFKDVVNNVAWTSMGDSSNATYNEPMTTGGWTYNSQVSIDKGFLMQAKDFDKIYQRNEFQKKAEEIIEQDKKRIKAINQSPFNFKSISIGIIAGGSDGANIADSFRFYSPTVYPFFYATGEDNEKGLGMNFPEPKDKTFLNNTHYLSHTIVGDTSKQLLEQFKGKFDYLIYSVPDFATYKEEDVLKSQIVSLLKDPSKADQNIGFGKSGKWYTSAWGIIGKRELLTNMIAFLNKNNGDVIKEDKSLIWEVTSPEKLERLRKNEAK